MHITILKAKLHQARVTQVALDYDGSCAIDDHLLELSGIQEHEQIQIYNINNGSRLTTYAIRAERNSGLISINGAAARRACIGDQIIICSYASMEAKEAKRFDPTLVYLDCNNQVLRTTNAIPVQVAS